MSLLDVQNLGVHFQLEDQVVEAVRGVSFHIEKGETVALVGESGSGKSVSALSVMQLLPYPRASHPHGSVQFDGGEMLGAPQERLQQLRGDRIAMIFQEPMTSLNPLHTIEKQIGETLMLHRKMTREQAREHTLNLLQTVHLPDPETRLKSYPHQLSGGQRQRVMIAMALANEPDLLIADEPTTALDVTIQAQILKLLKDAARRIWHGDFAHHARPDNRSACGGSRLCNDPGENCRRGRHRTYLRATATHVYTQKLLNAQPKGTATALNGSSTHRSRGR